MSIVYNNIPQQKTASSSDATLQIFDNVNNKPLEINNQVLIAMTGFLETRGFQDLSAEQIAITILRQAKIEGYDSMAVLNTLKGKDNVQLNSIVGEILNYNRFKTSTLGIVSNTNPVDDIQRNIVA